MDANFAKESNVSLLFNLNVQVWLKRAGDNPAQDLFA
jgi:hypothetical protein